MLFGSFNQASTLAFLTGEITSSFFLPPAHFPLIISLAYDKKFEIPYGQKMLILSYLK